MDLHNKKALVTGASGDLGGVITKALANAGVDVAVSYVGDRQIKNLDDLNQDVWDRVLETNLWGPFFLSRSSAKYLSANGNGRIVNIASVGGILPESSSIAYSASKAGLIHLTRCLAVAMAPSVAINCIAPGLIENTRIAKNLPDEIVQANLSQAVLGKVGSVEDIAAQVVLFCKADTITGQIMIVDSGMPARMR